MIAESPYSIGVQRQRAALLDAVYGPIAEGLQQSDVTEVIVDPSGAVWFDRLRGGLVETPYKVPAHKLESIITQIAGLLKKQILDGLLEGEFPLDGSRIQAWLPPVAIGGPSLVVRKHRKQGVDGWPALTIRDYKLSSSMQNAIEEIICRRESIIACGATSAGKSTFLGAFLHLVSLMFPNDRIVTIEDTAELYCTSRSYLPLHSSESVSMQMLLKSAMRARPDRIVVGEVRGPEAVDLIMALGTGHAGMGSVHGGTTQEAMRRILQLCGSAIAPEMISDAIRYVFEMRRDPVSGERTVARIGEITGWDGRRFTDNTIAA